MKRKDAKVYKAVGLMSGTSLDGVDAVAVETNGEEHVRLLGHAYVPYPHDVRARVGALAKGDVPLDEVLRMEQAITRLYVQAVEALEGVGVDVKTMDVVGCHGQTIRHLPDEGLTWQLCDPHLLAERVGLPVVSDFRRRDMAAGGQGAPLVPLFHKAVLGKNRWPCALLNLGGVANITLFDADGNIQASDCGPGMGLVDLVMQQREGKPYDEGGSLAFEGTPVGALVSVALTHPFFHKPLPRSADRYEFNGLLDLVADLPTCDALATLCCITAAGVSQTLGMMLERKNPEVDVFVVGGGAHNEAMHVALETMGLRPYMGADVGLRGATMEAECFAWLAVRRLRGLPFSTPATTGCAHGTVGGGLTA